MITGWLKDRDKDDVPSAVKKKAEPLQKKQAAKDIKDKQDIMDDDIGSQGVASNEDYIEPAVQIQLSAGPETGIKS